MTDTNISLITCSVCSTTFTTNGDVIYTELPELVTFTAKEQGWYLGNSPKDRMCPSCLKQKWSTLSEC